MGTSLTGLTPATTYDALIKTGDNAPIDATLKTLSDGLGNNLPMEVSTTSINFTGTLLQSGTAVPTQAQVNAKQDTLVSGTNIKTINGTSVLGSGNITTPTTSPGGSTGQVQFNNAGAFGASSSLFWDNTNSRLGIGTSSPSTELQLQGSLTIQRSSVNYAMRLGSLTRINAYIDANQDNQFYLVDASFSNSFILSNLGTGFGVAPIASTRVAIKGTGSTSATTSLLVQNSAGTELAKFNDDGSLSFGSKISISTIGTINTSGNVYALGGASVQVSSTGSFRWVVGSQIFNDADGIIKLTDWNGTSFSLLRFGGSSNAYPSIKRASNNIEIKNADDTFGAGLSIGGSLNASSILQADSTTKGFLPPRMTTTQKNAISSPASGLVVYDTDTNKLCCYNGTSWNDLF